MEKNPLFWEIDKIESSCDEEWRGYLYTADLFLFFCPMRKPSASSSACPCLQTYASMTSALFPIRFQEGKKMTKQKMSVFTRAGVLPGGLVVSTGAWKFCNESLKRYELQNISFIILTKIFQKICDTDLDSPKSLDPDSESRNPVPQHW